MSEFAINSGEAFNDVIGDLVVEGPSDAVIEEVPLEQCNVEQKKPAKKHISSAAPPPPVRKVVNRPRQESSEKAPKRRFIGRCRLLIGNLPTQIREAELKELFTAHGDISECYLSGKGVAFLRMDTPAHAESAKEALDGKVLHDHKVFVRFAMHRATIRLKELAPVVTNEMLQLTFSAFGEVERALHILDAKGNPTGEGIVEFEKKSSATAALSVIRERIFLLTTNSRPLYAEMLEPKDEEDGLAERLLQKTESLMRQREAGPRFAKPNSFDENWGQRWKKLYEDEQLEREKLNLRMNIARQKLQAEMDLLKSKQKVVVKRPAPVEPPAPHRMPAFQARPAKRAKPNNFQGKPQGFFNTPRPTSAAYPSYNQHEDQNYEDFNGYQANWSSYTQPSRGSESESYESDMYASSNNYYGGHLQVDNTLYEQQYFDNTYEQHYPYESY